MTTTVSDPRVAIALGYIAGISVKRNQTEAALYNAVRAARADGATWEQIAAALGVTSQAAWERFHRTSPPRGSSCPD